MTTTTWVQAPIMGLVPLFHLDPALGGPPQASPDGHWWWDGARWVTRPSVDTEAADPAPELGAEPAA